MRILSFQLPALSFQLSTASAQLWPTSECNPSAGVGVGALPAASEPMLAGSWKLSDQRRGGIWHRPDDPGELAALQQLAALTAAAGDLIFRRADRLLRAARGLDRHQIAIAYRSDEAQHAIGCIQFDQD